MSKPAPKRKASMALLYSLTAALVMAGVFAFALLYSGNGADALRDANVDFDETLAAQPESVMDIRTTPAPTPTPTPVSMTGRMIPYYENGLWGYKNTKRQVVIEARFEEAHEFEEGIAFAKENGLFGLLSINDVWLVEPCWTQFLPFSEELAAVEKDGKWGYIDRKGEVRIDYAFREAGSFHCGRAMARTGSAYGYIDIYGTMAVSAKWRKAGDFSEDLAFATSDEYEKDRHYIIDKIGEKVATLGSKLQGTVFSEGFAVVIEDNGTHYYLNSLGSSAFQTTFLGAQAFSEGMAAVRSAEGWGYINTLGSFEIPAQFEEAAPFSEGCAAVREAQSGLWGYIDLKGNWIIEPAYDEAGAFLDGYATAMLGNECYLLDKEGGAFLFYTK